MAGGLSAPDRLAGNGMDGIAHHGNMRAHFGGGGGVAALDRVDHRAVLDMRLGQPAEGFELGAAKGCAAARTRERQVGKKAIVGSVIDRFVKADVEST